MTDRIGYWSLHKYRRRSVEEEIKKLGGFVGWKRLLELAAKFQGPKARRNRALYATAFLTGGRIGEVLLLKTENFTIDDEEITVEGMRLFKRYEKIGEWTEWRKEKPKNKLARLYKYDKEKGLYYRTRYHTKKKEDYRSPFSFPREEPLAPILIDWIESRDGWLFPGYKGPLSYIRAYQILTSIGIHPHWLRAQRASCLISFYGLKMEEMMEWMGWEELSTARLYAKFGKKTLTMKMAKREYPQEALKIQESLLG